MHAIHPASHFYVGRRVDINNFHGASWRRTDRSWRSRASRAFLINLASLVLKSSGHGINCSFVGRYPIWSSNVLSSPSLRCSFLCRYASLAEQMII